MMLPSSTYANTSALCRCAGTIAPGEKKTVSTRPSFPGTSGRVFVIRGVSFALRRFALLEACDWNSANTRMNNENTYILIIHKLLIRSLRSEDAAAVLLRSANSRRVHKRLCATSTGLFQPNERACRCWDPGAL